MTIRLGSARSGFLAIAALAIAACTPDHTTAPNYGQPRPNAPAADIANLTTTPRLFGQTSSSNDLQATYGDQLPIYYADDFVVPQGAVWTVTAVSLTGNL